MSARPRARPCWPGAAGFATSFATTHRGADGRPIPSRFAEPDEFEALFRVLAELGRGVVHVHRAAVTITDSTNCSPDRPAVHLRRLLTPRTGATAAAGPTRRGLAAGDDVWPQVTPPAADVLDDDGRAVHVQRGPVFAELLARPATPGTRPTPTPSGACGPATSEPGPLRPRWDTFNVAESRRHPELSTGTSRRSPRERGMHALDLLLDVALDEAWPRAVKLVIANDDPDGVDMISVPGVGARAVRRRRPRRPAVRRRPGHRPAGPLGPRARRADRWSRPCASCRAAGRPLGLRRPGLPARRARPPTSSSSTPPPSPPGPCVGCTTSPPAPSGSPPTPRPACSHVFVNGTPIRRDGASLPDGRPGRVLRPN